MKAIRQLPRRAENSNVRPVAHHARWPKLSRRQTDDRLLRLQFAIIIARVICDLVAAKMMCRCLGCCFGPDANGLYLAQDLTSGKGKWTMKAGVVYPQIELGGDTGAVKAFARRPKIWVTTIS